MVKKIHGAYLVVSMARILVAQESEISAGAGRMVSVEGKNIGLFRGGGNTIYAMPGTCAHRGGPVGDRGKLKGTSSHAPWHGWQYDVTTGECKSAQNVKLPAYKAIAEDGKVYLEI